MLQAQPSQQQRQTLAARSAPDGYTVFLCAIYHSMLPGLKPKHPGKVAYDSAGNGSDTHLPGEFF